MSGGGGGAAATVPAPTPAAPVWQDPAQKSVSPVVTPILLQQLAQAFPQGALDQLLQPMSYQPRGLLPPIKPSNKDVFTGKGAPT